MSKILNIDDMLEAADMAELPTYILRRRQLEEAARYLAEDLGQFLDIEVGSAGWQGKDFGGLCASFNPRFRSQPCPLLIDEGDPGGDWDEDYEDIPGRPLCLNRKRRRSIRAWFTSLFLSREARRS